MTETMSERLIKMVDYIAKSLPMMASKIDEIINASLKKKI